MLEVKTKIPDAFVIAFENGVRMDINEAKKRVK